MPFNDQYRKQVVLLIRTLPFVAAEKCFALKGGIAINLFMRDMPRSSVDIDPRPLRMIERPVSKFHQAGFWTPSREKAA
jgi:hypothetical protein